jgi:hypothetical protein
VGEKLRLASTVSLSRVNTGSVPTDGSLNAGAGAVGAALNYYPVLPVRQPNGAYTLIQTNNPSFRLPLTSRTSWVTREPSQMPLRNTRSRVDSSSARAWAPISPTARAIRIGRRRRYKEGRPTATPSAERRRPPIS